MTTTRTKTPAPHPADDDCPADVPVQVALAAVMREVRAVGKDERYADNRTQYSFRGIDGVLNAVGPALRKHGVIMLPSMVATTYRDTKTVSGKDTRECTVMVTWRVIGPQGDHIEVMTPGESLDTSDKGTAKAMSVALRIALIQTLALPTDERDPDADRVERGTAPSVSNSTGAAAAVSVSMANAVLESGQKLGLSFAQLNTECTKRHGHGLRQASPDELTAFKAWLDEGMPQRADRGPATPDAVKALEAQFAPSTSDTASKGGR